METAFETIALERRGRVALLTLDRPERLNAMNRAMLGEMQAACDAVEADAQIRALVLTGRGRAFSSGFDLQEQAKAPPEGVAAWERVLRDDFEAVMRFWHLSKPTVAAVRGPALAGGCELAMACDITVAADDAVFGEPELRFGAGIVVMLLPWLAGPKRAKEVLLTGRDGIGAEEAREMGLVNRVVPAGEELAAALAIAADMAVVDPAVMQRTKAAINESYRTMGLDAALEQALTRDAVLEGAGSEDKREFLARLRAGGLKAALAWREARFSGGG